MIDLYIGADGVSWERIGPLDTVDETDRPACVLYVEAATVATGAAWAELRRRDGFVLATWGPGGDTVRQDW